MKPLAKDNAKYCPPVPFVQGAAWVPLLLEIGPDAIAEAATTLAWHRDLTLLGSSTIALIASLVSTSIRKRILLKELEAADWNLSRVAERCRMNVSNLIRELRAVGLGELYDEMRAKGVVKQGVRRGRPKKQPVPWKD